MEASTNIFFFFELCHRLQGRAGKPRGIPHPRYSDAVSKLFGRTTLGDFGKVPETLDEKSWTNSTTIFFFYDVKQEDSVGVKRFTPNTSRFLPPNLYTIAPTELSAESSCVYWGSYILSFFFIAHECLCVYCSIGFLIRLLLTKLHF